MIDIIFLLYASKTLLLIIRITEQSIPIFFLSELSCETNKVSINFHIQVAFLTESFEIIEKSAEVSIFYRVVNCFTVQVFHVQYEGKEDVELLSKINVCIAYKKKTR